MKNIIATCFFAVLFTSLFAQQAINLNFFDYTENAPCPYDSTQTIIRADDWDIYQTIEGTPNGTVDSTRCFGLELDNNTNRIYIDLSALDISLPLFIHYTFTDENKALLYPNTLYEVSTYILDTDDYVIRLGDDCQEGFCSAIYFDIEIPDSTGTGTARRAYTNSFGDGWSSSLCMPTERFEAQYLRDFLIKITFEELAGENGRLRLSSSSFSNGNPENYFMLSEFVANDNFYNEMDSTYYLDLPALNNDPNTNWPYTCLVLYDTTSYPSAENIFYAEAYPENNADQQATINLTIEEYESLVFQPYTRTRGALVEGSDTLRHIFNLVNNGGMYCMIAFAELVFDNDNAYIHNGGEVDFSGNRSCMMFYNGGHLRIGDDAALAYGDNGEGILLMGKNGTIKFGNNSTLILNNHLRLWETTSWEDEQVYIDLQHGSHLIFGEHARLSKNTFQENGPMRLNVYMNGGTLDDSRLSPEERRLIKRIYPSEPPLPHSFVTSVAPNPTDDVVRIDIATPQAEALTVHVLDVQGQLLEKFSTNMDKGESQITRSLAAYAPGIYLINIETASGQKRVHKVVRQ